MDVNITHPETDIYVRSVYLRVRNHAESTTK